RRSVVIFFIVLILYYIGLLVVYPLSKNFIASLFPEKDPPTLLYGALPPLEFVEKEITNSNAPKFNLDTKDGKLPSDFPVKITVYKVESPIPSFEKGRNAVDTAAYLGYKDEDLVSSLKETVYRWRNLNSNGILEINTDTRAVVLKTNLSGKSSLYPEAELTKNSAEQVAKKLFEATQRFTDPLYKEGTVTVNFGKFSGTRIISTKTTIDSQIARVDFFRNINEYPILGPDPKEGLLYTYLRKPDSDQPYYNYPIMESHTTNIQTQSNATYPTLPISQAWNVVSQNKGVIVNITPKGSNNIVEYTPLKIEEIYIQDIYLAYYDTPNAQSYLQPIYVFEGTYTTAGTQGGNIVLYYPAITPENIQTPQN
ncbi:hypothetical protein ACFL0C_01405, partial [Patescibacteria group bacterium]